jgi:PAS domain S-box-containing protein
VSRIGSLHEGEELLRRILDAVPGGVVHVDRDGSVRRANPEALRILGLKFDDLTSRFIADFATETILEDGAPCPVAEYPVAKVLATGNPAGPTTIGVRKPNGETSWAVFRAEPLLDPDGELAGAVVTFLDITDRKHSEEKLRKSEQRWRSLAQNLPDFVLVADRDAKIRSINRRLRPSDSEEEVIGRSCYDFIASDSVDRWRATFEEAVATSRTQHIETLAAGPNNTFVWYEAIMVPIAEGVLVVARDINERRSMIASLAEKERLASVGMLAASVAHEIMNPLTYVLANLDFATGPKCTDADRQRKALGAAREGAARMQQIVWDLRALGRSGSEELFYVDARAVLETALRLCGPEVAKNADVVFELGDVPSVRASESRLCQVFINLLVNAAQSMAGARGRIQVRTRHDEAKHLAGIVIEDTGEGISPESLPRIFEPFYTTKRTGTGLGLSICRDIVERMGGRIEVTSSPGEGSTFTVWLSTLRIGSSGQA